MTFLFRKIAFSAALVCLALTFDGGGAFAKPSSDYCSKPSKASHVHKKRIKKSSSKRGTRGSSIIRVAQEHLAHLGYYMGRIDGVMGAGTKAAIKNFQRDHGLKADGVLGKKTIRALADADRVILPPRGKFMTHDNVTPTDAEVHQDYQSSLNGVKLINSRFARIEVQENGEGSNRVYSVMLNGQSIMTVDNQPSVIGISKTYDLGDEDAIIFTTYRANDTLCSYKTFVLALNNAGNKLLEAEDCTRGYQAEVNNGMLTIVFPERDANRATGATWRLEGMRLDRL